MNVTVIGSLTSISSRIASIERRFDARSASMTTRPVNGTADVALAGSDRSPSFSEVYDAARPAATTSGTVVPTNGVPFGGPLRTAVPWSSIPGGLGASALPPRVGATSVPGFIPAVPGSYGGPAGISTHGAGSNSLNGLDGRSVAAGTPFAPVFDAAGARHGVPPRLLASIGWVESRYDVTALSPDGAQGLMQLMPFISEHYGVNPHEPAQAVDAAARLLAEHRERFGSWDLAVASYFSGAGAVSRAGNTPPTPRSHEYVRSVTERLPHV